MAMWGALVFIFVASSVSALPDSQQLAYPEDVRVKHFEISIYVRDIGASSRIVSGWEASEGQIPYQLSLRAVSFWARIRSCGASLIHHRWAVTAGHCLDFQETIVIRAGAVALSRPALIFESVEHLTHPLFMDGLPFVQPNDIGIVKFDYFVEYSARIQPIRFQPSVHKDRDYSGIKLQASGWGLNWTRGIGVSSENLNWVNLVGVSNEDCLAAYNNSNTIVASTICAGPHNVSSQSTCDGDSGGPLAMIDEDGKPTLVGIISFVSRTGCHTPDPAGFIRPGHYLDWIQEVTGIDFDWDPKSIQL